MHWRALSSASAEPLVAGKINVARWDDFKGADGLGALFRQQAYVNGQWVGAADGASVDVSGACRRGACTHGCIFGGL